LKGSPPDPTIEFIKPLPKGRSFPFSLNRGRSRGKPYARWDVEW
jgi:hypothetical protein